MSRRVTHNSVPFTRSLRRKRSHAQTRSITLIVFETLSYCDDVRLTAVTADFFIFGCEQGDDLAGFELKGDDYRPGIMLLRYSPLRDVDSKDDRRSIRSFTGGISYQQDRCSKLHLVFTLA